MDRFRREWRAPIVTERFSFTWIVNVKSFNEDNELVVFFFFYELKEIVFKSESLQIEILRFHILHAITRDIK